ncbi:helix-turn-helix domain-containing protein [Mycolicibacter sinensis]|uniref:helix-turn-helix domain-containing protein n=1 Tax=Mycolicibacter sinensis (strain JDM601) TaxID=875328 RepID=UPI0009ED5877|nr:helix-turn-helix domain-containing protein [Mycolicibacter sinensis]
MSGMDNWAYRIGRHIGPDGSVMVPPRIAQWLEAKAGLTADRRINLRTTDPAAYEILSALHLAALSHRSGNGTKPTAAQADSQKSSSWITTVAAAAQLGVTDRCIRKWIAQGRIPATRHGGRWLIRAHQITATQIAT